MSFMNDVPIAIDIDYLIGGERVSIGGELADTFGGGE
jgi:hypothetical protein